MKSDLNIKEVKVEKSSFEINPSFAPNNSDKAEEFEFNVKYQAEFGVKSNDEKSGMVRLGCSVNYENFDKSPFKIHASVVGFFNTQDENMENYFVNATSILFPYLRAHVATVTSISGVETITLPPVNVIEMLRESEERVD